MKSILYLVKLFNAEIMFLYKTNLSFYKDDLMFITIIINILQFLQDGGTIFTFDVIFKTIINILITIIIYNIKHSIHLKIYYL